MSQPILFLIFFIIGQNLPRAAVVPRDSRVVRYPYHDSIKVCWERSDVIPAKDQQECVFQAGSFFFDSVDERQRFDLTVTVLDDGGNLAANDVLTGSGEILFLPLFRSTSLCLRTTLRVSSLCFLLA